MDEQSVIGELKKIELLPTFPNIVREVMDIIENPLSSASDVAQHLDPSLVSEVLRIANSAYYGTKNFRRISSIEHAIAVIGFGQLSLIILQMPFLSLIDERDKNFDRVKYINHSLTTGAIGKGLSETLNLGNPNEVYVSGVIHDLGIIVLYRYFKREWVAIRELMEEKSIARVDAEREIMSMDHGYLGGLLLEIWNIPEAITEAVKFHHFPDRVIESKGNIAVLYIANRLAKKVESKGGSMGLDEFILSHRGFLEEVSNIKELSSPKEELDFFETIHNNLKGVLNMTDMITEQTYD
ncbi:MAG: HDOD domain-containing protein [Syntrophorhabdaceae bacterium]|nr:HDOD domain-containing protein [Syntrophorhabdaceae bacterium]